MWLLPSKIRYSQDTISNTFSDGTLIGEVLDRLCNGRMRKRYFPPIGVKKIGRLWFTSDNRRLWVFRQLEELGMCGKIPVYIVDWIPRSKMTTTTNGLYVDVRGYPGGYWIDELEDYYDSEDEEFCDRFGNFRI